MAWMAKVASAQERRRHGASSMWPAVAARSRLWLADHTDAEVVGVDLSGSQLTHARRWIADGRRPNLRFVQHDVMHLDELAEQPFDAALCLDAACYLPDRAAALCGIATRLRPGGRLLLVDWCRVEHATPMQRELVLEPLCRYWAIADLATVASYRRAFGTAGLRIRRVDDLSEAVVPNWERGGRRDRQARRCGGPGGQGPIPGGVARQSGGGFRAPALRERSRRNNDRVSGDGVLNR